MKSLSLGVGLFCVIFSLIVYHFIIGVQGDHNKEAIEECTKSWVKPPEKTAWPLILILVNKLREGSEKGLFRSQDGGKFVLSFCSDPTDGDRKKLANGLWNRKEKILLGNGEKTEVEYKGSNSTWLALHMKNGDSCKSGECGNSSSSASSHNYNKATVLIVCDPAAEKVKFYQISSNVVNNSCSHIFILSTKLICDLGRTIEKDGGHHDPVKSDDHDDNDHSASDDDKNKKSSHFNGLGYFFFILFLLAAAYMMIGFLYKRHVLGARGLEQIPNYLFWLRIVRNVQAFFASGSPHQRANQRYRQYDDDFRYDQPPLMADDDHNEFGGGGGGAGGGGASSEGGHVQQNSSARRPSPSTNSNAAAGGGGAAKDDADVRLLVV